MELLPKLKANMLKKRQAMRNARAKQVVVRKFMQYSDAQKRVVEEMQKNDKNKPNK